MLHYIKTRNGRVSAIISPLENTEEWTEEEKEYALSAYDGMAQLELPADFDFAHIGRYGIDENGNLIDNGLEDPSEEETEREPTNDELLLDIAGNHEYRICLMELGVTEDDLQTV